MTTPTSQQFIAVTTIQCTAWSVQAGVPENISPRFNGHFSGGPGTWVRCTRMSPFWSLLELRMMEVASGDNWSYKTCKAPTPSTNQHQTFYGPDALPVGISGPRSTFWDGHHLQLAAQT